MRSLWHVCLALAVIFLLCDGVQSAWWRRRRRRCSNHSCQWHWGSCNKHCGGGRQYPVKTKSQGSCGSCSMPSGPRTCNNHCCRVNCHWYSWGSWGRCSKTCGGGIQVRKRGAHGPSCGGTPCRGSRQEHRQCNAHCCSVHCKWSPWQNVGHCSTTCGNGIQLRSRSYAVFASCGGKMCSGPVTDSIKCNVRCCPRDCEWDTWQSWSTCTKTCGIGNQRRSRSVAIPAVCGGRKCLGPALEQQSCNTQCCVIDCLWGDWNSWTSCTQSCDGGEQARERSVDLMAQCGGKRCRGEICETRPCNDNLCCPRQCEFSYWSEWSICDKTCGSGLQSRQRQVTIDVSCKAQRCLGPIFEQRNCSTSCCPVDCVLSAWSYWSKCSTTCGNRGAQHRSRIVERESECSGKLCETNVFEEHTCNRFCLQEASLMTQYGCVCADGWRGECCERDINECEFVNCTDHSTCINTMGSYDCVCHHNYTKENDKCVHFDKCATGRHQCHAEAGCIMNNREDYICNCDPGFSGNGFQCLDVDECASTEEIEASVEREYSGNLHKLESSGFSGEISTDIIEILGATAGACNANATCQNTYSSFVCQCDPGFTGDGYDCSDIDECSVHSGLCSVSASCTNAVGSYTCWCDPGYFGDGKTCEEINECISDPCANGGLCIDGIKGFECQCTPGYEGSNCVADLNECEQGPAGCNAEHGQCVNIPGSYLCECKPGFNGNGTSCIDIDECALGIDNCHGQFPICRNALGNYICECKPGTELINGVNIKYDNATEVKKLN